MKNYKYYTTTEYHDIREFIEAAGEKYSERTAISYRNRPSDEDSVKVSFTQLRDDVRALGTELIARGYRGKHCALIGKLTYHWICSYFAVMAIGGVLVPLDREWHEDELAATVAHADCSYMLCDPDLLGKSKKTLELSGLQESDRILLCDCSDMGETLCELINCGKAKLDTGDRSYFEQKLDPSALSLLVFTSGTTGKGKGVMHCQKAILSNIAEGLKYVKVTGKSIAVLPPHHTFGSTVNILGHVSEGSELYLSSGIRYITKELKSEKPGHLVLVPLYLETFYRKILAALKDSGKEKLVLGLMKVSNGLVRGGIDMRRILFHSVQEVFGGNLSFVITGGAPISQEIADAFESWGVSIINGYGITECAPLISVNRNRRRIKGSVGYPLLCEDIIIADKNKDGEGEIRIKGPNVMLGYYKDEKATADAFDENGYFRTGDIGKLHPDNILFITGRCKNLIILSNGKNVYPEEIESELSSVAGVLEVVVYEGKSRRGLENNAIVAEIYPDNGYFEKNGIQDTRAYLQKAVDSYNRAAVSYKKIGMLKVRDADFEKNTLRKILRFRIDTSID
jgi:long-chain acyl-CoA synthetase